MLWAIWLWGIWCRTTRPPPITSNYFEELEEKSEFKNLSLNHQGTAWRVVVLQKGLDLKIIFVMKCYEVWPFFMQLFEPAKYTWNSTCINMSFLRLQPKETQSRQQIYAARVKSTVTTTLLLSPIFNLSYSLEVFHTAEFFSNQHFSAVKLAVKLTGVLWTPSS